MADLKEDLKNKYLNYLNNKHYKKLQLEINLMGEVEKQHPLTIFFYACAIALDIDSTKTKLLFAEKLFNQIYLSNKNNMQILYNMIAVSFKTKEFQVVLPHVLEAYENNKKDLNLLEGLAKINFFLGNNIQAIKYFKILFQLDHKRKDYRLSFVSSLNYVSGINQEEYLATCKKYVKLYEDNLINDKFKNKPLPKQKIKIAFLSGDLKTHSVSYFLKDLILKIDKKKFEIIFFSNLNIASHDNLTASFKKESSQWFDIIDLSDEEVVKMIRNLNIDILIDLSGFFERNRLQVIANRCARKQIMWLGYNNSLGIKNIDYLIADPNLVKKDELNLYSEKILFLPKIWNSMSVPETLPKISKIKKTPDKIFSYGSFNNYQKLSDDTIKVWSEILKNSNSKIYLKNSILDFSENIKNNIINKFCKNGVNRNQVIILERTKSIIEHYESYKKIDVALDTFPYPGVTTSFESILMGVPVLTMKGFNLNSRCGESIIRNLNLTELIADNETDYVEKAIALQDEKNLIKISGLNLRDKALSSPLFDTDSFTKDFEKIMLNLV